MDAVAAVVYQLDYKYVYSYDYDQGFGPDS